MDKICGTCACKEVCFFENCYRTEECNHWVPKASESEEVCIRCLPNGICIGRKNQSCFEFSLTHDNVGSEWIPVAEMLPENNKKLKLHKDGNLSFITVLAYKSYGSIRIVNRFNQEPCGIPYLDEHATNGWEWSINGDSITHWMPLPEPPKEE